MLTLDDRPTPRRSQQRDEGQWARNRATQRRRSERQFGDGDHEEFAPGDVQHC